MEIYEFKLDKENIMCTFYSKSNLSKEVHAFKFGGQRVEEILKALGLKDIKNFKRINNNDLQLNYLGGRVYIRNLDSLLGKKVFSGINKQLENRAKKIGEKRTNKKLKKHLEWGTSLKKKASRSKSVANYNKNASFTKKEAYTFKFDGDKPICTFSGTSKLINKKFSYTYSGPQALKTLNILSENKVKDFQMQKSGSNMQIKVSKGNIYIEDFLHAVKNNSMKKMMNTIEMSANKMSQKEFKRRMSPLNKKTATLNKSKSAFNTGKKIVLTTALGAALLVGVNNLDVEKIINDNNFDLSSAVQVSADVNYGDVQEISIRSDNKISSSDIEINYEERFDSEKLAFVQENFSDVINKYSKIYGLDPNLVTAIVTQENGYNVNSDRMPAAGPMQLEKAVWADENITAFNHETKKNETFFIDQDKMTDIDINIKAGCMILRNEIDSANNDLIYGIAAYNMGKGNMNTIVKEAMEQTGESRDKVLKERLWLDYTYAPGVGDKKYVKNVLSYFPEGTDEIYFYGQDGVKHVVNIINTYEKAKTR